MVVLTGWEVRLCGPLQIASPQARLEEGLPGRQGRLLFGYLLTHRGTSSSRSELIDLLWPEAAPATADGALSALLSKLRKALGDGVLVGRSGLKLVPPGPVEVDVERAEALVADAQARLDADDHHGADRSARAALTIDLLSFLPGTEGPWVQERRRELESLRLRALEIAGQAGLGLGTPSLGVAEQAARAAVAAAPFRESAYRLLMEILAAGGNEAEALRTYEELRVLLREELGIVPGKAISALHEQILRGELKAEPTRTPPRPLDAVAPSGPEAILAAEAAARDAAAEARGDAEEPVFWPGPLAAALDRHAFVGRTTDLAYLRSCWEQARVGARQIVAVSGDPGVGKTRLAAEISRVARDDGALVLYGRCDEETLGPFQPVVEAFRGFAASGPTLKDLSDRLGPRGAELARLLPELGRMDRGDDDDAAGATELRDADGRRFRLFSAVGALMTALGAQRPVLLVIDDLHWADRPTLQLLRHLARAQQPERLLILGTYRDAEIETDHPLNAVLADLRREAGLKRLSLEGLAEGEVGELVAELAGTTAAPRFVSTLHGETEGNPFFIEEVLRHLRETDGELRGTLALGAVGVPEGVREITARRLRRLREDARATISVAAVIGREFDFDVLEAVGPVQDDALVGALDEALDARVVREVPGRVGRYAFAHALIRATIYDGLSALRRARMHGRIGTALERLRAADLDGSLALIAHHYVEAAPVEQPERAVEFAIRAGRRAEDLLAYEEAAEHFERALRTRELAGMTDERGRCELLLALGEAQQRSGEDRAGATFLQAAGVARGMRAHDLLARAALGYAGPWAQLGVVREDRVSVLEEALAAVGDAPEHVELRARLLARLTLELYYAGTPERRLALSEEAVTIARSIGEPSLLALCLDARHYALWRPENAEERLDVAHEACDLAVQAGDRERLLESLGWTVVDYLELGDIASVDAQIERAAQLAEAAHLPLYLWWVAVFRAMRALLSGQFEDGERLALEALAIGQRGQAENAVITFGMQMYCLRREQGRLEEVLDPVRGFIASFPAVPAWRGTLALAHVELGRLDLARQEFDQIATQGFSLLPRDANWLICVTLFAEVCGALGDVERAEELYVLLAPYAGRNTVVGRAATCNGSASRLLGVLATVAGRWSLAERHFEEALEMHETIGARPWAARTRLAWAEMALARRLAGDGDLADRMLSSAAADAEELGMVALRARIDAIRRSRSPEATLPAA